MQLKSLPIIALLIPYAMSALAQQNAPMPLSLEKTMDMAEEHSFTLRIAKQSYEGSNAQENAKIRALFPNVSASGNYLKYSDQVNKAVGTAAGASMGVPDTTTSNAGLTLTQPIMGLLTMSLSIKEAAAQTRAALHAVEQSKENSRLLGASAFLNAQKAKKLLAVANSSYELSNQQLKIAQAQLAAGRVTASDVLKFKFNTESSKASLISAESALKVALVTLAEAIGMENPENFQIPEEYQSVWKGKESALAPLPNVIQEAFQKRADVASSKALMESAHFARKGAVTNYLPSVNFVADYRRNLQASDVNIPASGSAPAVHFDKEDVQDMFYYGLQFQWNLLDWGVRQAQISAAVANEQSVSLKKEQLESQVKVDVTQYYLKIKDARQMLDSVQVSVQYAQDVYEQVKAQFQHGRATSTDLITAANDQTFAKASLANVTGDLDLAWLSLKNAMGEHLTTLN